MSMADEDNTTGAIDTGDSYTPPAEQAAPAAAPQAAPTAPQQQPSMGLPDVGKAPFATEAAGESMQTGMQKTGQAISRDVGEGIENVKKSLPGRVVKGIVSYLLGADASHPDMIDQAGAEVDPQGQLSPGDRNLLAIQAAHDKGGDQASWPLLQANRVAYNAQTAFAKTALQGTQQKPADLRAAVDAANKAQGNLPDGSNVKFAAGQQGVTATVTMPGTTQAQTINLTSQQFGQFLDVGGDGQWDKVMNHSVPATLQRIASSNGAAPQQGGATKLAQLQPLKKARPYQPDNSESDAYQPPSPTTNFGKTPSTLNLSGSDEPNDPRAAANEAPTYDPEVVKRGQRMFPSVSQQAQRDQWMSAQEQRQDELQNKVDVAKETGENRVKAARETGNSRVQAATVGAEAKTKGWQYSSDAKLKIAQTQLASKIAQQESANANASQTRALKAIQTKMMSAQPLTPQEQSYLDTLPGAGTAGAQVTAPGQRQQSPAPQAAPQAAPQMSAHDQQAAAWARANPNDPRAAQIKQKLGVQ